jgi:hypothetical protein
LRLRNFTIIGINYFINTGATCSNGAQMWSYIRGIPDGSSLGKNVQKAMADMGLPALRGLAPGMLEDVQQALDPSPMMNALFGSGYPQCKQVTLPVGDSYGRIASDDGESWISDPHTAKQTSNGFVQTRWVQDTDYKDNPINLSRENWLAEEKTHNKDGTPIKNEAFANRLTQSSTIAVVGVLCLIAFSLIHRR